MTERKIYLGSDHAGFDLKEVVKASLITGGYEVQDLGALELDEKDDYPSYADAVAKKVATDAESVGMLFCGNAEGVCIVANKTDGVRAAIGYAEEAVKTARTDDDANIICFAGRLQTVEQVIQLAHLFVSTTFSNQERHLRRLAEIKKIEEDN